MSGILISGAQPDGKMRAAALQAAACRTARREGGEARSPAGTFSGGALFLGDYAAQCRSGPAFRLGDKRVPGAGSPRPLSSATPWEKPVERRKPRHD